METDFQRGGIIADFSGYTRKKELNSMLVSDVFDFLKNNNYI